MKSKISACVLMAGLTCWIIRPWMRDPFVASALLDNGFLLSMCGGIALFLSVLTERKP